MIEMPIWMIWLVTLFIVILAVMIFVIFTLLIMIIVQKCIDASEKKKKYIDELKRRE